MAEALIAGTLFIAWVWLAWYGQDLLERAVNALERIATTLEELDDS